MEESRILLENWFDILSAVGIIGGLVFTAVAFRSDAKARQIANLLTITNNHREIWKEFFRRPDLARVLNPAADIVKTPIAPEEREFVNFVIFHLSSVYYAMRDELVVKVDGLRRDAGSFFSLPIPKAIWEKSKTFQNDDFIAFIEDCVSGRPVQ